MALAQPVNAQKAWSPKCKMICAQGSYSWRTWLRKDGEYGGGELYVDGTTYPIQYRTKSNRGEWRETTVTGYVIDIGGNYDDNFSLYNGSKLAFGNCKRKELGFSIIS